MAEIKPVHCEQDYWQERWIINDIAFHKERNNPFLEKHIDKLIESDKKAKILFPLCGKAVDMAWLASLGHEVIGIELAQEALEQFFSENKIHYTIEEIGDFKLYKSLDGKIRLYKGDFFKFTPKLEGLFECIWDRGGLVALPINLRKLYADHIKTLLDNKKFIYLLVCYEYDQDLYPGPPHSVKLDEIRKLYGSLCKIQQIDSQPSRSFNNALVEDKQPVENLFIMTRI